MKTRLKSRLVGGSAMTVFWKEQQYFSSSLLSLKEQ